MLFCAHHTEPEFESKVESNVEHLRILCFFLFSLSVTNSGADHP